MSETHPMIALFQGYAETLDTAGRKAGLDDAITLLAGWMELAEGRLSGDDRAVLVEIGGILYREGLGWRVSEQGVV